MKKIITLFLLCAIIAAPLFAQKTKPAAKPKPVAKKITKNLVELEMYIKEEDGSLRTEKLKTGDKLVYHVNAGGAEYDFIATLNKANVKDGFDFNYEMTNTAKTKGRVKFSWQTKYDARKYVNYFKGGELILKDAVTVWLSGVNFSEMPDKKTELTLDNNAPETFYRPENDEYVPTINFRGKEVKLDGFFINNKEDGTGDKTICIHNSSANTLILKMNLGFSIELKEIK